MPEHVMLAHTFKSSKTNPNGWLMSKKIDGMRAYWNGLELRTRGDNRIHAPEWFTDSLPPMYHLDGELVFAPQGCEVGNFQQTCSVVKRHNPDERWEHVIYFVFDAPKQSELLEYRYVYDWLQRLVLPKHVSVLDQIWCNGQEHLNEFHDAYVAEGGEGIIIRDPSSHYEFKRSKNVQKVKIFTDAEAVVIDHLPGKGRHEGRLGGLICNWEDGRNDRVFHVGVGFTDAEREDPHPIGAVITFQYFGMTDGGSPRHPKYMRLRSDR